MKKLIFLLSSLLMGVFAFSQVAQTALDYSFKGSINVGTGLGNYSATQPSAWMQFGPAGTNKAVILPRVNSTASIVTPTEGMQVYNLSDHKTYIYTVGVWSELAYATTIPTNYWQRTGTTLSTATAGDKLNVTGLATFNNMSYTNGSVITMGNLITINTGSGQYYSPAGQATIGTLLVGNNLLVNASLVQFAALTSNNTGYVVTGDFGTGGNNQIYYTAIPTAGFGTVKTANIVTANGFSGTTAGGNTSALSITLATTTGNGILKSQSGSLTLANPGVDYLKPGTAIQAISFSSTNGNLTTSVGGTVIAPVLTVGMSLNPAFTTVTATTFIGALSGTATNTTGIQGVTVPTLTTGSLTYTGSQWTFTTNATVATLTFTSTVGSGAAPGSTYNGVTPLVISANTISALPLSGGTLSGALTGTNAAFSNTTVTGTARSGNSSITFNSNIGGNQIIGGNETVGGSLLVLGGTISNINANWGFSSEGQFIYANRPQSFLYGIGQSTSFGELDLWLQNGTRTLTDSALTIKQGLVIVKDQLQTTSLRTNESGTFNVTMTCGTSGTITLSTNTLKYTRVGSIMMITGVLIVGSVSSPVGQLNVNGLPLANATGLSSRTSVGVRATALNAANNEITGILVEGATSFILEKYFNGDVANLAGDVKAGTVFTINLIYSTQ